MEPRKRSDRIGMKLRQPLVMGVRQRAAIRLFLVLLVICGILDHVSTFTCDLAARPGIIAPTDPAAPLINSVEFVKPSLEILFGSIPGSSVVLFVLDKLLTNPPGRPSVWDQVKDEVEHLIDSKLDQKRTTELCNTLKEFRHRIDLCELNSGLEKTRCYSTLLDYMIGKEPHFRAVEGRDVALTLGIYTAYTVMTLSVGKVFLILSREHKLRGVARLKRLKPAALRFSTYVNESVPVAVNWRRMEVGEYNSYKWNLVHYEQVDSGTIEARRRRENEFNNEADSIELNPKDISGLTDVAHQLSGSSSIIKKQGILKPTSVQSWGKLVVTDNVNGRVIFEKDTSAGSFKAALNKLFEEAKVVVAAVRNEEGEKLETIYKDNLLRITNEYWRIYERSDFGT